MPPVIQMLLFGYAATFEVYHVSTVVLDLDHTQESRELVARFTSSNRLDIVKIGPDPAARSTAPSTAATRRSRW